MTSKIFTILFLFISCSILGQIEPVLVADLTLKVPGLSEQEVYYGFSEGDQIIFTFSEEKGKGIKEVEIVELPGNSKFKGYKSVSENKNLKVYENSVYKFKFSNTALGSRICKVKIERIPNSRDLISFNTDWKWKTVFDTIYVPYTEDSLVGYDTLRYKDTVKELVRQELREELILEKNQKVHSKSNEHGNRTSVSFALPTNDLYSYNTSEVISWAYWVGVDEAGDKAWEENTESLKNLAIQASSTYLTPLGALALGEISSLTIPNIGEDVSYSIADHNNRELFLSGLEYRVFDQGKGVAGYHKFFDSNLFQGSYSLLLSNDNYMQGINVNVRVIAIIETKEYKDRIYDRVQSTPKYITLNKIRKDIKSSRIRVNAL